MAGLKVELDNFLQELKGILIEMGLEPIDNEPLALNGRTHYEESHQDFYDLKRFEQLADNPEQQAQIKQAMENSGKNWVDANQSDYPIKVAIAYWNSALAFKGVVNAEPSKNASTVMGFKDIFIRAQQEMDANFKYMDDMLVPEDAEFRTQTPQVVDERTLRLAKSYKKFVDAVLTDTDPMKDIRVTAKKFTGGFLAFGTINSYKQRFRSQFQVASRFLSERIGQYEAPLSENFQLGEVKMSESRPEQLESKAELPSLELDLKTVMSKSLYSLRDDLKKLEDILNNADKSLLSSDYGESLIGLMRDYVNLIEVKQNNANFEGELKVELDEALAKKKELLECKIGLAEDRLPIDTKLFSKLKEALQWDKATEKKWINKTRRKNIEGDPIGEINELIKNQMESLDEKAIEITDKLSNLPDMVQCQRNFEKHLLESERAFESTISSYTENLKDSFDDKQKFEKAIRDRIDLERLDKKIFGENGSHQKYFDKFDKKERGELHQKYFSEKSGLVDQYLDQRKKKYVISDTIKGRGKNQSDAQLREEYLKRLEVPLKAFQESGNPKLIKMLIDSVKADLKDPKKFPSRFSPIESLLAKQSSSKSDIPYAPKGSMRELLGNLVVDLEEELKRHAPPQSEKPSV